MTAIQQPQQMVLTDDGSLTAWTVMAEDLYESVQPLPGDLPETKQQQSSSQLLLVSIQPMDMLL